MQRPSFPICIQASMALLNAAAGTLDLLRHNYLLAVVPFVGAAIIVGISISTYRLIKRGDAEMAIVFERQRTLQEQFELHQMQLRQEMIMQMQWQMQVSAPERPTAEAYRLARENMQKVVKAIGGKVEYDFGSANIRTGPFLITHSRIYNVETGGDTCYWGADMPADEKMASAALLLHRNPGLFEYWRHYPGEMII